MSAAQATGDPFCACGCGAWLGQCSAVRCEFMRPTYAGDFVLNVPRLREPPPFYVLNEPESLFPTTPPGVLNMYESDEPPATQRGSDIAKQTDRDLGGLLLELREMRKEQAEGFAGVDSNLSIVRHELQGFAMRLTGVEHGQRDMRAELRAVKEELRDAIRRIDELEKGMLHESASPAAR